MITVLAPVGDVCEPGETPGSETVGGIARGCGVGAVVSRAAAGGDAGASAGQISVGWRVVGRGGRPGRVCTPSPCAYAAADSTTRGRSASTSGVTPSDAAWASSAVRNSRAVWNQSSTLTCSACSSSSDIPVLIAGSNISGAE